METTWIKRFTKSKLFTLLVILIALVVFFSVWAAAKGLPFFNIKTFVEIGDLLILSSFLAVGAGFIMVSGNLDLSAAAIGAMAATLTAACMVYWGFNPFVAIVAGLIAGMAFGLVNAVLVNQFKFPAFIATMAMAQVIGGVRQWISAPPGKLEAGPVNVNNAVIKFIGNGKLFDIVPFTLILAIVVFIIYGLILAKTKFGMQVYMVGGNPQAARLSGISPVKTSYILYLNSAFLAGVCGIIGMSRINQASTSALASDQFTGLTAAILGGVSFGGGTGNMAGVFVGLLILKTWDKGTTIINANSYLTEVMKGVLLLLALTLDYFSARSASKAVGLIKPARRKRNSPVSDAE